jgi:tetratricopeptide (TPR) repeat protein
VLACGWRARMRNVDWLDEVHLWSSAVQASPASAKAHKAYAAALLAADPEQRQLDRVTAEGEQAVAIRPDYLGALIDLGSYYLLQGDRAATSGQDAAGWYERSVRVLERARLLQAGVERRFVERMLARGATPDSVPDMANALLLANLSLAYVRAQRYADALEVYEEWRRFEPGNVQRYVDISAVLCNLGRWEDASIALFQATILDAGNDDASRRLAEVYRTFYPQGRAVTVDAREHVQINLDEPVVRRHRCRAYTGLGAIFTEAGMKDEAARVRATGRNVCGRDDAG